VRNKHLLIYFEKHFLCLHVYNVHVFLQVANAHAMLEILQQQGKITFAMSIVLCNSVVNVAHVCSECAAV
jgi:hypothetical protein